MQVMINTFKHHAPAPMGRFQLESIQGGLILSYDHSVKMSEAIGVQGTAFEGEVKAIKVELLHFIPRIHNFNRAVILIDSKAAIQAVASNTTPKVPSITDCRQMLQTLSRK
jgi:hypothetical protein